jgi:hypothetical protein
MPVVSCLTCYCLSWNVALVIKLVVVKIKELYGEFSIA